MAPKRGSAEASKDSSGRAPSGGKRKPKADEDSDDDLLSSSRGSLSDSFVTVAAVRWIVNLVTELTSAKEKAPEKEPAPGRKKAESAKASEEEELTREERVKQWAASNKIPAFLMTVGVLVCAVIIGGESVNSRVDDRIREVNDDFYGTLGVPRDADTGEVKRAYKTLARRWHPDRNPNCSTCQETFAKIASAYETLADEKKRSAYDESGGVASTELTSKRSVPLNRDNFDELVTFSNDVWIVQIFKPADGSCAQFHPFWENQIQKHGNMVRFGRIDITTDPGKWLPVKVRVLPMVLKFRKDSSMPEIFPITAMHETPQTLMKFVLTSFPNIGLPLHTDKGALSRWLGGTTSRHKVLFAIPGRSEEERYKSHLVVRKLANRWSELFEFRTAETSALHKLSADQVPAEVRSRLPASDQASSQAAVLFFEAGASTTPKAAVVFDWIVPVDEDEIVVHLMSLAERAAPSLSAQSAELLCRSLALQRVYCLVLLDPSDAALAKATLELKDSRTAYAEEVAEIREGGGDVGEEEDNFHVLPLRLHKSSRILQPSIATCHAPKFGDVEKAIGGAGSFLMDFDQGRVAALKGVTSFRGLYPQIAYEDSLEWTDGALHPFLSLPDCNEGTVQHLRRSLFTASLGDLLVQFFTLLVVLEAVAKAAQERSLQWSLGAGLTGLLVLGRSPWCLRQLASYLPVALLPRPLLVAL